MPEKYFKPIPFDNWKMIWFFWDYVEVGDPEECWPWLHTTNGENKYGLYKLYQIRRRTYYQLAHRIAYAIKTGIDPKGLVICHKCDNPICCNPNHMFLGTIADNNRDRHRKGRTVVTKNRARGSEHGLAKLTEDKVREIRKQRTELGTSYSELARQFGVGADAIRNAIHMETWKHVK